MTCAAARPSGGPRCRKCRSGLPAPSADRPSSLGPPATLCEGDRVPASDPPVYELPFRFDVPRLQADVRRLLERQPWIPYFEFHAIALRAIDGRVDDPRAVRGRYVDTPLFGLCPYLREVADRFACPKQRIRLFRLAPGGRVTEHIDHTDHTFHFGTARIMVPVFTNPQVDMRVNGERVEMKEGEAWYVDTSFYPHAVVNRGSEDRVHFVIDCQVNDWMRSLVPSRFASPRWRRPFDYRLARLRLGARNASLPRALYDECWELGRVLKSPRELSRRLFAWMVAPSWARTAPKRGERPRAAVRDRSREERG